MFEPVDAAFEEGFEEGVSGPDSGPEVKGEDGRGDACGQRDVRIGIDAHAIIIGKAAYVCNGHRVA